MRILFDYRPALRERTGVGQYVHELAAALAAELPAGDTLTLFSSSWKDRLPPHPVDRAETIDLRIPVRLLNAAWHRLEFPPIERLAGAVDVAHSLHPLLMPTRHALRVVTIHDLDFLDHPERTRAEIRRDYPSLAAVHARRADLVVVNSHYTGQQAATRLGLAEERIVVCRPGAPAWTFEERSGAMGPILFVGTIEPRKNLPALFDAYARVAAKHAAAPELILAGGVVEQSREILDALANHRGLNGRVRHLGYVSDATRAELYRTASMLVLPSLEEGFGLTALEAMQAGVPVVASNRGALPEVLGDAGTLVDPLDAQALALAIEALVLDPGRRAAHARAGRARAARFSWRASALRLLDAYRAALDRRTRSTRS